MPSSGTQRIAEHTAIRISRTGRFHHAILKVWQCLC